MLVNPETVAMSNANGVLVTDPDASCHILPITKHSQKVRYFRCWTEDRVQDELYRDTFVRLLYST